MYARVGTALSSIPSYNIYTLQFSAFSTVLAATVKLPCIRETLNKSLSYLQEGHIQICESSKLQH